MHKHFVSLIYGQNLARNIMGPINPDGGSICQNIYVSRHVLVYRHIHFWTNGSQVFWNGGSTQ